MQGAKIIQSRKTAFLWHNLKQIKLEKGIFNLPFKATLSNIKCFDYISDKAWIADCVYVFIFSPQEQGEPIFSFIDKVPQILHLRKCKWKIWCHERVEIDWVYAEDGHEVWTQICLCHLLFCLFTYLLLPFSIVQLFLKEKSNSLHRKGSKQGQLWWYLDISWKWHTTA